MLKQISILTKLELCNIFGLNVLRHTKDKKVKRKAYLMAGLWIFVILMVFSYVGGLSYGLLYLEAGDVIPAYLITLASLVMFFFGVFKAGGVIFNRNNYDILCSLPVPQSAIVASRFLRMYVENLILTLAVMIPGIAVYAWFLKPGVLFYLIGIICTLFIPMLPIAAATFLGALVTAIASRMKHKSVAEALLSVVLILGILGFSSRMSGMEEEITIDMLKELSATVTELLGKLYPPAVWMGNAMVSENLLQCLGCVGLCIVVFLVVVAVVSVKFHPICRGLFGTYAKHNYRMEKLQTSSAIWALCKKEFKRYFSSGIYVTNTIIGPIMGTVLSIALCVVGLDTITANLPISIDVEGVVPFFVAGIFCMMTVSSVAVSMEGKNWWIVKTLPLSAKTILDAKILMNLLLFLPFWLVAEVFLILALKPDLLELFWMILVPIVIMVFSCVYGIFINLLFPVMNWESEVSVVKQSASALLGGMGGMLVAVVCAVIVFMTSASYLNLVKLIICGVLLGLTALLYRKNNRVRLQEI